MGERVQVRVVSAEIERGGRYLLTQRAAHAVLPHLWEFPGGKVHEGESDADALRAALARRLGVDVIVGDRVLEIPHHYPEYDLCLAVYRCRVAAGEPEARTVQAVRWVHPDEFPELDFPPADAQTVARLVDALE